MNVVFVGRVIDMYKSADPKYPNTSLTLAVPETRGQVVIKITPADAGKVEFDGLYKFEGVVLTQKAQSAFGASYLTFKEGVKVSPVKTGQAQ